MFAIKIIQPIIISILKKPDSFRHHSDCVCDERIAKIPSDHKKYKSRVEKRKDRLALRSTASYFFRNTEKRFPYVTTAAAQQQHSRSSSGGGGSGAGECGVGGGSTASLFLHSCRSITVVHQKERRGHIKNIW